MRSAACGGVTCSLDDVVQQSLQQASAPPANRHETLARLVDADADTGAALRVSQTPTVQALRTLCQAFVDRYNTLDALHADTVWWTGETARLRSEHGHVLLAAAPASSPPPSDMLTPLEREDLLQRTTQLLRATHSRDAVADPPSGGWRASTGPLSVPPDPPSQVIATANVLQLEDAAPATDNAWDSLDCIGGSTLQRSAEVHDRVRRDEECLRVLDAWVAAGDAPSTAAAAGMATNSAGEAERLESLVYVLRHRPELITGHAEASRLQQRVVASTCHAPTEPWIAAAFTLFQAVGAQAQLAFLHDTITCVGTMDPERVRRDVRLVGFVVRLLHELPESWTSLLDSEVTDLFLCVVQHVVVPFADALDPIDPVASWLAQWLMRPSFSLSMTALLGDGAGVVAELHAQLSHSSHVACVLLHLLPYLCAASEKATSDDADGSEPAWLSLFRDITQALTDAAAARAAPPVFELGFASLASCAPHLPRSHHEGCVDHLLHALLHSSPPPEVPERAAAGVAAKGRCVNVFAFRLLTELLLLLQEDSSSDAASCGLPAVWGAIDGPLRLGILTHLAAPASGSSLSESDVLLLQQAWAQLLAVHAPRLPLSLAGVVAATLTAPEESHHHHQRHHQRQQRAAPQLFTWATLVAVSATATGWTALHAHLEHISHGTASISKSGWAALLQAVAAPSASAAGGRSSVSPPPSSGAAALAVTRRPSPSRRPAEAAAPHPHIAFCSPQSLALLLRWSTVPVARDGLLAAAQEAARFYFKATQRPSKADLSDRVSRWPLLWPVEGYPGAGGVDLSYTEDAAASARVVRSLACYQSIALLLSCAAPPGPTDHKEDAFEGVWGQLVDVWLSPAQVLHKDVERTPSAEQQQQQQPSPRNGPPFDEASLLTLLCAVGLCLLVRPGAEYDVWFAPDAVARRLRPLRRFCVARCGVDPVYFMVRYLTSGKGRKRLPPILLDGCAAELMVDTVIDVGDFAEGEEWPAGDVALPVTEAEVGEVLHALTAKAGGEEGPGYAAAAALGRRLLAHRVALRTTPTALQQLLAARSAEEWEALQQTDKRALAVANVLTTLYPSAAAILRGADVDVFYLSTLCVSSWLWVPETHLTSQRRKLCWAALRYFSQHGVAAYDGYVARSLAAHIERLHAEDASCVGEAVLLPQQRPLPLPSSLFVLLLVKPFALTSA